MRPYLTIIRDSFHAALASRVLWIAFIAIWLVVAALAPIGYREDLTSDFRGARDLENRSRMRALLVQGMSDPDLAQTAVGRLAAAMPGYSKQGNFQHGQESNKDFAVRGKSWQDQTEDQLLSTGFGYQGT